MRQADLTIIGGGPAGLSAAINAASEGLHVRLLEGSPILGGQAVESRAVENYPGFAKGITGANLMVQCIHQAYRFGTEIHCPSMAMGILTLPDGTHVVKTNDFQDFPTRAILLSTGLAYRRLQVPSLPPLLNHGVYYGMPTAFPWSKGKKLSIAVVGGANSAGQAVVHLAKNPNVHVRLLIRSTITKEMSQYLIDRILSASNVEVCERCEVTEVEGETDLKAIQVKYDDGLEVVHNIHGLFIFIGGIPKTAWMEGIVETDEKRFVRTDTSLPYATSLPGVFAAGDVRLGSVKRIAAGIGEGSAVVSSIHRYLSQLEKTD